MTKDDRGALELTRVNGPYTIDDDAPFITSVSAASVTNGGENDQSAQPTISSLNEDKSENRSSEFLNGSRKVKLQIKESQEKD